STAPSAKHTTPSPRMPSCFFTLDSSPRSQNRSSNPQILNLQFAADTIPLDQEGYRSGDEITFRGVGEATVRSRAGSRRGETTRPGRPSAEAGGPTPALLEPDPPTPPDPPSPPDRVAARPRPRGCP